MNSLHRISVGVANGLTHLHTLENWHCFIAKNAEDMKGAWVCRFFFYSTIIMSSHSKSSTVRDTTLFARLHWKFVFLLCEWDGIFFILFLFCSVFKNLRAKKNFGPRERFPQREIFHCLCLFLTVKQVAQHSSSAHTQ